MEQAPGWPQGPGAGSSPQAMPLSGGISHPLGPFPAPPPVPRVSGTEQLYVLTSPIPPWSIATKVALFSLEPFLSGCL